MLGALLSWVMRRSYRQLTFVALLLLLLASQQSDAAPANTVLSGALKCAIIGDDRKWLDCYYGAAQSLRTALGLTSASDGQLRLFEEPTAGPIPPGSQDIRAGDLSNAFSCPRVGDDKDWLNCFYAAAQPMRAHLGLAAAPAYTPRSAIDAGAIGGTAIVSQEVHGIRLRTYSFDHAGIVTIALENGQVWKQIESDSNFAHWHGKPDTYVARITKGFWAASI
jgi:hypothetical protein